MLDKSSVRTFLVPEGSISVLLKRAAAGFILRFGGLGILSNKRPDGNYWPSGHCLLILSGRSDKIGYRNLNIIGTIVMKANRINNSYPKSSDKKWFFTES